MSIKTFVDTLASIEVAGVKRRHGYPPLQINTADLPASFVRPPSSTYEPLSTCSDTDNEMVCALAVAIEPTGQSTQPANYAKLLEIADALNVALRASRHNLGAIVTWSISAQDTEPIIVGQTAYWGVTATVTKRG
jgi:hypothetical protein